MTAPTMKELAARINEHLKRFEADKGPGGINKEVSRDTYTTPGNGLRSYYGAAAHYCRGRYLQVTYIRYQGSSNLTREEATLYLQMLDSGFVGRHFEALRRAKSPK